MPENQERNPERNATRRISSGRWWIFLSVLVILVIITAVLLLRMREHRVENVAQEGGGPAAPAGVPSKARKPAQAPAMVVSVAPAVRTAFDIYITGLGAVTPVYTVTVHTRVDGQLEEVFYREGQMVRQGELLARLDARPFEAQLLQAQGQLARDSSQLAQARIDLERFNALWAEDSIAKIQLDTQASLVHQLEGAVQADRGLVEAARVNIVYCRITSPIAGRVGLRLVDPGNIVHVADPTGIAVVTQVRPMTVIFPIPEDRLPAVRAKMKAGVRLVVDAFDRAGIARLATGTLLTIDNQIDPTTGTVRLRAVFPNKEDNLFPNQFVNARLTIDRVEGATVIPSPAVQRGPQGTFVYLMNPDRTVAVRPVIAGTAQGGNTWVKQGLSPGESVVVEGVDRLHPGARVEPRPSSTRGVPQDGTQKGYL